MKEIPFCRSFRYKNRCLLFDSLCCGILVHQFGIFYVEMMVLQLWFLFPAIYSVKLYTFGM